MNQSQPVPAEDQGSSSYGTSQPKPHRLGLRENWRQFALYTLITLLIGMTI